MALKLSDFPTPTLCGGEQWSVLDRDLLVQTVALVLIGHASHVEEVLAGAELRSKSSAPALLAVLKNSLVLPASAQTYHRDGLLFETICWIAAVLRASPGDAVSLPHRQSTDHGADIIQVSLDTSSRTVTGTTVFEQKCTENPRAKFRDEVLPAFEDWLTGKRDAELLQTTVQLLSRFALNDAEKAAAYERIVDRSRMALRAALTVSPDPFETKRCTKLFKDYDELAADLERRYGDTFPLADVRKWFDEFAVDVWKAIEAMNV